MVVRESQNEDVDEVEFVEEEDKYLGKVDELYLEERDI